ncbi:MAG: hypothetical protein CM15mP83_9540 [Flavobacteriaceae bacterium]|nr:MAG: hypothetical protein CM15mP83_9540 [Flavobacteriaceae bacterium]
MNNEKTKYIISPRLQLSFRPKNKDYLLYRFATGIYAQPPFYRELRTSEGLINPAVDAQKAIHVSLEMNMAFPFGIAHFYSNLNSITNTR